MPDVRTIREDDLPAVCQRLEAEFQGYGLSLRNVRAKLLDSPYHPDLNLAVWDGPILRAALLGSLDGERAWIKALTTAPHTDASEVLLELFENRVRERGADRIEVAAAPSYFVPGIDPTDTVTLRFFLDRGFERHNQCYNMVADLLGLDLDTTAAEERLAADGYRFARLEAEHTDAFASFMRECFSELWLEESLRGFRNDPVTIHVAWHDGAIVAFAASHVTNPGWFGPTGTAPEHRRGGLGRVLLHRALANLRDLGYREADIGWVGPLGYYARNAGARVSRTFWMLRKALA